ncbi:MAG: hypothetical protein EXR80_02865 [Methylococcales bacterium]|nr:hypothetical protein [Methylococcales bacterium]
MKTHEFATQLDLLAKLLRLLPNMELEQTLSVIFGLVGDIKPNQTKTSKSSINLLPEGIEERLRKMAPSEIQSYFNSELEYFSAKQLLELAELLKITTSKRQSRSALVNLIIRYFEAGQMDSIIRSTRKDNAAAQNPPIVSNKSE